MVQRTHPSDEVLTRNEAAEFLKLPRRTLDYLVATNQIYFSRTGKRGVRFTKGRLLEWLRDREGVEFRIASPEDSGKVDKRKRGSKDE